MLEQRETELKEISGSMPESEKLDSELSHELDKRLQELLEGKSKEELVAMREELLKQKEALCNDEDDSSDDGHSALKLVLKPIHRR